MPETTEIRLRSVVASASNTLAVAIAGKPEDLLVDLKALQDQFPPGVKIHDLSAIAGAEGSAAIEIVGDLNEAQQNQLTKILEVFFEKQKMLNGAFFGKAHSYIPELFTQRSLSVDDPSARNRKENSILVIDNKISEQRKEPIQLVTLSGASGEGKTWLASQYYHQTAERYRYHIWLNANDKTFLYEMSDLALKFGIAHPPSVLFPGEDLKEKNSLAVKNFLESTPGWILVLDDVEDFDAIRKYIPSTGGVILQTTTSPDFPGTIPIQSMSREEARETLIKYAKLTPKQATAQDRAISTLLVYLDRLPLGITYSGIIIANDIRIKKSVDIYLGNFLEGRTKVLARTLKHPSSYHENLVVTWQLTKDMLKEKINSPTLDLFFYYLGFFNRYSMPVSLIRFLMVNDDDTADIIEELRKKSIITLSEDNTSFDFSHGLFYSFIRDDTLTSSFSENNYLMALEKILSAFEDACKNDMGPSKEEINYRKELLPHMRACEGNLISRFPNAVPRPFFNIHIKLLELAASTSHWLGDTPREVRLLERVLNLSETYLETKFHLNIGIIIRKLGNAYGEIGIGEHQKKLSLSVHALAIFNLAKTDANNRLIFIEIARTTHNLANALGCLGDIEQATYLLHGVLEAYKIYFNNGPHLLISYALSNLAYSLQHQGKIVEASKIHAEALEHEPNALVYLRYGHFLLVQGNLKKAAKFLKLALETQGIHRQTFIFANSQNVIESNLARLVPQRHGFILYAKLLAAYLLATCYQQLGESENFRNVLPRLKKIVKARYSPLAESLLDHLEPNVNHSLPFSSGKILDRQLDLVYRSVSSEAFFSRASSDGSTNHDSPILLNESTDKEIYMLQTPAAAPAPTKIVSAVLLPPPTPYEYFLMSVAVYEDNLHLAGQTYKVPMPAAQQPLEDRDWQLIEFISDPVSEYKGSIWVHEQKEQVVIAHRGSKGTTLWLNDIHSVVRLQSGTFVKASLEVLSHPALVSYKERRFRISSTGHSLGGFLGFIGTYWAHRSDQIASYYPDMSAVVFDAPGGVEFMEAALQSGNRAQQAKINIADLNVHNFCAGPTIVSTFGTQTGTVWHLDGANDVKFDFLNDHRTNHIGAGLDPKTGYPKDFRQMVDWPQANYSDFDSIGKTVEAGLTVVLSYPFKVMNGLYKGLRTVLGAPKGQESWFDLVFTTTPAVKTFLDTTSKDGHRPDLATLGKELCIAIAAHYAALPTKERNQNTLNLCHFDKNVREFLLEVSLAKTNNLGPLGWDIVLETFYGRNGMDLLDLYSINKENSSFELVLKDNTGMHVLEFQQRLLNLLHNKPTLPSLYKTIAGSGLELAHRVTQLEAAAGHDVAEVAILAANLKRIELQLQVATGRTFNFRTAVASEADTLAIKMLGKEDFSTERHIESLDMFKVAKPGDKVNFGGVVADHPGAAGVLIPLDPSPSQQQAIAAALTAFKGGAPAPTAGARSTTSTSP